MYTHIATTEIVTISTLPSPLRVVYGTTFTLSCNYRPYTFHAWRHPTLGEISESSGHVTLQVSPSAGNSAMIVRDSILNRDNGTYTCIARTSSGELVSQSTEAALYPSVSIFTPDNQVITTVQATLMTVMIPCIAVNHARLVWRRAGSGHIISNLTDERITTYNDRMVISGVRFSDNGTYTCTAFNDADSEYIVFSLVVYGKLNENCTLNNKRKGI